MRLKTYTAETATEALALVREELGLDAIIVSTQELAGGGVRVTAALDQLDVDDEFSGFGGGAALDQILETLDGVLSDHGLPERLALRLGDAARFSDGMDARAVMADALEKVFDFKPLPERRTQRPLMFMGPAGAGKTLVVAKLATRAVLAGRQAAVISTDTVRAGGIDQLSAFTRLLKIDLKTAADNRGLTAILSELHDDLVFIDSANTNPYDAASMTKLSDQIDAAQAEGILVLPAGLDAEEAADIAEAYAEHGARRLLVTRLDAARRMGGTLTAAESGNLCLCDASMTPKVTDGLTPLSPVSLARLLLPDAAAAQAVPSFSEVAS